MATTVTTEDSMFVCVDPMGTRLEPKETESAGVVEGRRDNGYFTTHRREVAEELRQRYPHMLVTETARQTGGRAARAVTWTVPEFAWKKAKAKEATDGGEHS